MTLTATVRMISDETWSKIRAAPADAITLLYGPLPEFDPESVGIGVQKGDGPTPNFVITPDDGREVFLDVWWDAINWVLTGREFAGECASEDRANPLYLLSCYGVGASELAMFLPDARFIEANRVVAVAAALRRFDEAETIAALNRAREQSVKIYFLHPYRPSEFDLSVPGIVEAMEDLRDLVEKAQSEGLGLLVMFS